MLACNTRGASLEPKMLEQGLQLPKGVKRQGLLRDALASVHPAVPSRGKRSLFDIAELK